jgi:3-oxoacyl-[acyl-carrier protein] reductase
VSLNGRTAVVTGAAQGLGEAIARALHARGASVVVADVNGEGAERVAASLVERARGEQVDVRDRAAVERMLDDAGRVDVLVNNAARTVFTPLEDIATEEWDDVLATNLRSVFFGCQLAGPRMREQRWGRILNMASISGQTAGASGAHYAASKAGIIVLTKIVASELAPYGVTCNALAPAAVRTPVFNERFAALPAERLETLRQRIPVGRFGEPSEIAELAAFLCSDEAGYITGATFDANGGMLMR